MSYRFEISDEMIFRDSWGREMVAVVDVPAIVRAEVERYHDHVASLRGVDIPGGTLGTYLAARFPETAPRCTANGPKAYSATECCCGGDGGAHLMVCPAGGAGARPEAEVDYLAEKERREQVRSAELRCNCPARTDAPGSIHSMSCQVGYTSNETSPVYTSAERDFLRELAADVVAQQALQASYVRSAATTEAARRVVEEVKSAGDPRD